MDCPDGTKFLFSSRLSLCFFCYLPTKIFVKDKELKKKKEIETEERMLKRAVLLFSESVVFTSL